MSHSRPVLPTVSIRNQDIQDIQDRPRQGVGRTNSSRQRGFLVVWGEIGRLAAPPASTWESRGQSLRCLPRLLAALGVDFAFANPTLHHEPNRGKDPCLMRLATVAAPRELPCLPAVPQKLQYQARGT